MTTSNYAVCVLCIVCGLLIVCCVAWWLVCRWRLADRQRQDVLWHTRWPSAPAQRVQAKQARAAWRTRCLHDPGYASTHRFEHAHWRSTMIVHRIQVIDVNTQKPITDWSLLQWADLQASWTDSDTAEDTYVHLLARRYTHSPVLGHRAGDPSLVQLREDWWWAWRPVPQGCYERTWHLRAQPKRTPSRLRGWLAGGDRASGRPFLPQYCDRIRVKFSTTHNNSPCWLWTVELHS